MQTYSVKVKTSRNTSFAWKLEESSVANVMTRIDKRIRGIGVVTLTITEMEEGSN